MGREWNGSRSSLEEEREPRGCMRGMLHFFDFHHMLFTGGCRTPAAASSPPPELQKPQQQQPQHSAECKGVEAPRNSLELDESVEAIREEYYGVPIGIQIVVPKKKKQPKFTEEERRNSQAVTPRTRSIVARLMGLEVFQDDAALSIIVAGGQESTSAASLISASKSKESSKSTDKKKEKKWHFQRDSRKEPPSPRRPLQRLNSNISGSISLPDTPRASSEKTRDTGPRYSLQLNKENDSKAVFQELDNLRKPCRDSYFPVSNALSFIKPTKNYYAPLQDENKSPTRCQHYAREIVKHMKGGISGRQACNIGVSGENKPNEKKALIINHDNVINAKLPTVPKPRPKKKVSRAKIEANMKMEPGKFKKARHERFMENIKRQSPSRSLAEEQPQLSMNKIFFSDINPKREAALQLVPQLKEKDPEFKYVKAIFARAGVVGTKALKWFSPSLPIDPSIFHILELRFPFEPGEAEAAARLGPLRHRWNRKLLFHLVEEILGDLLLGVPNPCRTDSEVLFSRLWSQIRGLPSADCRVVGDIDALVAGDLAKSKVRRLMLHASVVAEEKDVAAEIERDILDSLVGDAAASLVEHKIVA